MPFVLPIVVASLEFENLSGAELEARFAYEKDRGHLAIVILRRGEPPPEWRNGKWVALS
jgi:hypothetical protein